MPSGHKQFTWPNVNLYFTLSQFNISDEWARMHSNLTGRHEVTTADINLQSLGWRAMKTPTSATPVSAVTWPRSRFNTSGPDPLGFDWEDLAASRGTAGGHHGGYPENRNVRYASHNMADAEPGKKQLWPLRNHVACSGLFHIGINGLDCWEYSWCAR